MIDPLKRLELTATKILSGLEKNRAALAENRAALDVYSEAQRVLILAKLEGTTPYFELEEVVESLRSGIQDTVTAVREDAERYSLYQNAINVLKSQNAKPEGE